jgi:photosystem II stability/assembly factor-like uncharacterized protein
MKFTLHLSSNAKLHFSFGALLLTFFIGSLTLSAAELKPKKRAAQKATAQKQLARQKTKKTPRNISAPIPTPRTEEQRESDVEQRREWFMFRRTFPNNDLPAEARRKAWLARPDDASFEGLTDAAPQWRQIGPQPTSSFFPSNWGLTSGRINAIAVAPNNPNLILIGAATGGIWRSTDGGANFASVSDGHVDLAVGSIAFAPSNPSIVYAGMGDKAQGYLGTGVLKSTDGGQTWARINNASLPAPGRISQILVDAADPNRVYAAQYAYLQGNTTFASGFFVSTDGGVNWTKRISGLPRDLVRHPTQPNTYYLAMQRVDGTSDPTGGVFKSVDAGQNWTRVYTAPFTTTSNIKVAVTPAAAQNVYVLVGSGSTARVEISTNEGGAWTNLGSNFDTGQFSYNCYLFVHPTDPNTIFVGTRDLWRSTNGGVNYTNITNNFTLTGGYTPTQSRAHPDQHHFYISPTDPNLIYIANDGGLWRSTNGAATFQSLNSSLALTMFVSLDLHPTDPTRSYGGTQDNGTQKRNGAVAWREFATGDGGQTIIDAVDPSIVYTTYVTHTVYRYINNGDNFGATIGSSAIFAADRVAFYPPFVNNGVDTTLYFGTYRLYVSTTRGANWTAPGGTTDLTFGGNDVLTTIGVSRSNTNVIYTGSAQGRVQVSQNGGANWTDITAGLPQRFIENITVSPTDPNTAYLAVSGYGTGHIFKTTNAGANWTDISGNLPDIPTNALLIDPRNANTLYAGTDIGVFRSTTGGGTWETFNMGLPPTIVTELDAQPGGLMQAATYGRGAYEIDLNAGGRAVADFDGDGRTDLSVFRAGNWFITNSSNNQFRAIPFGQAGDAIAPGDFDGDNKTDTAVFRAGNWYILNSSNNQFRAALFGQTGDKPVAADYDGDGKADIAVFRSGAWYITNSSNNQFRAVNFGTANDLPVPGDYDADGKTDVAVFRPSNGTWYVTRSSDNGFVAFQFGANGDRPVAADYDADGKTDFAVYRNGTWYLQQSTAGFRGEAFGTSGDIPAQGDYDGDGKTDFAVFRPTDGNWYIKRIATGAFTATPFGQNGDVPVPAGYNPQ